MDLQSGGLVSAYHHRLPAGLPASAKEKQWLSGGHTAMPEQGNTSQLSTPKNTRIPRSPKYINNGQIWLTTGSMSWTGTTTMAVVDPHPQWMYNATITTANMPTWVDWNKAYAYAQKFSATGNWYPVKEVQEFIAIGGEQCAKNQWIYQTGNEHMPDWIRWNTVMVETEEQRLRRAREEEEFVARRAEQQRIYQAERSIRREELIKANNKSKELLLMHLDAQQKRDVLQHGWFEVISDKGRRWRIRMDGLTGNVDLMPENGENIRLASYCAHPPGRDALPLNDHFLAQKLVLETDEERFTRVAYVHYQRPGVVLPIPRRAA